MYSCTIPMPAPGWGGGGAGGTCPQPYEEDVSALKNFFSRIICTVMVWWSFGCLDGFGCFNGPHDGYANRSNSQMSLLCAKAQGVNSVTVRGDSL